MVRLRCVVALFCCLIVALCLLVDCADDNTRQARKEFDALVESFQKHFRAFIALHYDRMYAPSNVMWDILFYEDSTAWRKEIRDFWEKIDSEIAESDTVMVEDWETRKQEEPEDTVSTLSLFCPDYYDSVWIFDYGIIDIPERKYIKLGYISAEAYHDKQPARIFEFYFIFDSGWIYAYSDHIGELNLYKEFLKMDPRRGE